MKRLLALLALLLLISAPARAGEKLPVVASFSILGDMVKTIGGEDITLTTLVGPDTDTHTYEPTPRDAKAIANAKLVVLNGLGFEGWLPRLLESTGFKGTVITASNGVEPRTMTEEEDGKPEIVTDPHAWQNIGNGLVYINNIEAALAKALPDRVSEIHARAAAYKAQARETENWIRAQIDAVPAQNRIVITSHDAFGYFGAAYGVRILAPQGLGTEAEPAAAGVAALIDQIKREHVREIFVENMTDPRLIRRIAKDTGAGVGRPLYSDALSPANGPAATWLDMFRNNVPLMTQAMQQTQRK